jgi:hypothetical protein
MFELLGMTVIGLIFLAMAILIRSGRYKRWYLGPMLPPFRFKSAMYFGFPFCLFWFTPPILALLPIPKEAQSVLLEIGWGSSFVLSALFAIWQPRWLKPTWLRRLEDQYNRPTERLLEARWRRRIKEGQMSYQEWAQRIETQKGLDELVQQVRVPLAQTDLRDQPIAR